MAAPSRTFRFTPVTVLAVTTVVFAIVVAYVTLWLRAGLHEQILQREARAVTDIASVHLANEIAETGVENAPGQLLTAVLNASKKMRGVFAMRVFDANRRLTAQLPFEWSDAAPAGADWGTLQTGKPVARLHSRASVGEVLGLLMPADPTGEPLLETWLPLRQTDAEPIEGAAQVWMDGHAVADEFRQLDRRLIAQAVLAWAAGSAIIVALLGWAFRRLAAVNTELRTRSEDLLRANRELALAAKTSALGAVTAHLMHELKNPVAGLEEFVAAQSEQNGENGGELSAASELTRRLRKMINDVAAVIRDEQQGAHFELTCAEVVELAVEKVTSVAAARGVVLATNVTTHDKLPGRRANLTGLVLHNLLQNAIEASAPGSTVNLAAAADDHVIGFTVADEGPGLAPSIRVRLFQPCSSTKPGGSGLGLALSQQLARQAGGRIELVRTGGTGTVFRLALDLEP